MSTITVVTSITNVWHCWDNFQLAMWTLQTLKSTIFWRAQRRVRNIWVTQDRLASPSSHHLKHYSLISSYSSAFNSGTINNYNRGYQQGIISEAITLLKQSSEEQDYLISLSRSSYPHQAPGSIRFECRSGQSPYITGRYYPSVDTTFAYGLASATGDRRIYSQS